MTAGRVWIEVHGGAAEPRDVEARAVWDGLMQPLPTINQEYFYDDCGSVLFEPITRLPEYYQSRTELAMLEHLADEIVGRARPHELVELGSGAGRKVHLLLDAIRNRGLLTTCVLLDANTLFLRESARRLAADYPEMLVRCVQGDFTRDLGTIGPGAPRLYILLAGTIGNLPPSEFGSFLSAVRAAMVADDRFLVGLDLVKDAARLEAAYNDAAGVTADFNRNILLMLNARFGTDFDPLAFEHRAFWDPENRWIEMRLRASRSMIVTMEGEARALELGEGVEIRTELSCKFSRNLLEPALAVGGFSLDGWWTDPAQDFALALLRPEVGHD